MKRRLMALLLCLLMVIPLPQTALAATTTVAIDVTGIESAHNYANNTSKTWTLSCPGADSITMTFDSRTSLESNYDFLYIYNSAGAQVGKYSGTALAGQPITVSGEKATLKLTSDSSNVHWGFKVTSAYATIDSSMFDCTITVTDAEHGTVTVSKEYCMSGETITITATPDPGYGLTDIFVDGQVVDGSFVATKSTHVVSAQFVELFPGRTVLDGGICGNNLEWYLFGDGQLYITGTGTMDYYDISPWYEEYREQITSVAMDSTVTSIGYAAFQDCSNLTSITIPSGVTSIGSYAFSGCSSLTSITIPSGVTSIGSYAFYDCPNLTNITIPSSVTSIGSYTFSYCDALACVFLPDGITSVGNNAFYECSGLTDVFCAKAKSNVSIGSNNSYLTDAYWHNVDTQLDQIVALNVSNCENGTLSLAARYAAKGETLSVTTTPAAGYRLVSLTIDNGTTSGSTVTISSTGNFTQVTVGAQFESLFPGKTVVDSGTCGSNLNWYFLSDGQLYITGTGAMSTYSSSSTAPWYSYGAQITSVVVDSGVTSISAYAFYNCSGITSVVVPSSVTSIGSSSFRGCSSLAEMTLPFVGNSSSSSASSSSLFGYIFGTSSYSGGISTKQYYGSYSSYYTTYYIPSSLRRVHITGGNLLRGAFYGCSGLTCVILPDDITSVGVYAFSGCSGLTDVFCANAKSNVSINSSYNTYLDSAYWHTADTEFSQIVPINVSECENGTLNLTAQYAAKGETISVVSTPAAGYRLASLTIDNGTTSGSTVTLSSAGNFTQVTVGGHFEPIRAGATTLEGGTCGSDLNWHMYEDGTLYITGSGAMTNYSSANSVPWCDYQEQITSVIMDNTVTTIGSYAFYGCSSLPSITIPSGVTSIGNSAFYGCAALTSVTIPSDVTSIGSSVFSGCSALTSVTIPDSVTSIGSSAFSGCSSLTSVTIPSSVTSIAGGAFSGCSSLVEMTLPFVGGSVKSSGSTYQYPFGYIFGTTSYTGGTSTRQYYYGSSTSSTSNYSTYYIPSSLRRVHITGGNILYGAFYGCSNLTCVILPDSISSIGTKAFSGCSGLTDVFCATAMGDISFGTNNSYLTDAYWHQADTDLANIVALTAVNENGTISLPCQYAAKGETIPVIATPISGYRLVSLTIDNGTVNSDSVTIATSGSFTQAAIGAQFELARSDKAVVSGGTCGTNLVWTIYDDGELYIAGTGEMTNYNSASVPWSNYRSLITSLTIEPGVATIGDYAFYNCTALTSVAIPAGVTFIGRCAFSGCSALANVSVPASVTSFGGKIFASCPLLTSAGPADSNASIRFIWTDKVPDYVLDGCDYLTKVTIPDSVTQIGNFAFYGCSSLTDIVLPANLTSIGNSAFRGCSNLASISIPGNVASIDNYAFASCTSLTGIIVPGSVIELSESAFSSCTALTSVTIENGVKSIGTYAFSDCTALTSVTIENGVESIGTHVFDGCTALESISLPVSVTGLGSYAFNGCSDLSTISLPANLASIESSTFLNCTALASVTIPDSVTSIGSDAFKGCSKLTSVTLSANLESIGDSAFSNCTSLAEVNIPNSTTNVGSFAFSSCSKLANIIIPGSVTTIGSYAFQNCTALTSVTIPEGVTNIGTYAFRGCSALTSVSLPASATSMASCVFYECPLLTSAGPAGGNYSIRYAWTTAIPANAFEYCTSLTTVTIPKSVTTIGNSAFHGCSGLTTVYYTGTEIYWATISIDSYNTPLTDAERICISSESDVLTLSMAPCENGTFTLSTTACITGTEIQVSAVPKDGYKCSAIYVDGNAIEGTSFTATGNHTVSVEFTYYQKVTASGTCGTNVHWYLYENGELYITGSGAMNNYNTSYGNPTMPWKSYRSKITSVIIDGGVTSIGNYAFYECSKIAAVELPDTLEIIGSDAFYNCDGIAAIELPDTLTDIYSYAFDSCGSLTSIVIPNSVTYIGSYAFRHCSNLTSVTLSSELTEIPSYTFANCVKLTEIIIPDKVTSIAERAFVACTALTKVTLPDSLTTIGDYAFSTCSSLVSINIPDSVTAIGTGTFTHCSSLIDIAIPSGVTTVEVYTFATCTDLVTLTVPGSVTEVKSNAFDSCSELDSVFYIGTEDDWNDITIRAGNEYLTGAQRYYISSEEDILRITPVSPENGTVSVNRLACVAGVEVQVTAIPNPGYKLSSITVDGVPITGNTFAASGNHTVSAQFVFYKDVVDSGTCGSNARWVLYTDGELHITGTGSISQYYYSLFPWYKYREQVTSLTIEKGITSIPGSAFSGCSALTGITIPDSVTSIGSSAFSGCSALPEVTIPDGVTSIGNYAFRDCDALASIVIPNSVTSIDSHAFYDCDSLAQVTIGNGVTSIGSEAFRLCDSLTEVTIGNGVTSIGNYAFYNTGIDRVEFLGNAPTTFGSNVFPSSATGKFVIYYHSGTTGWTTPTWNGYYTACIGADLGEYGALDENLRNSQGILFTLNDDSMTAIVGDNSVAPNNSGYFGNNDGNVVIPATVTKGGKTYKVIGIGQRAFEGNHFLKSLELGANITSVDPTAFLFCPAFEAFTVAAGSTHYSANDGILYDAVGYYLYCYPAAKAGSSYTVPNTVKTIGQNAFFGNTTLTELTVPDNVQTIGSAAFAGCTNLESITLPFIGSSRDTSERFNHAFYYCRWDNYPYVEYTVPASLKTVTITGGTLNENSFYNCYYIQSITLPAQDTVIPSCCFYNCRALKQLLFTDTIEASKDLEEGYVILPERITSIGYEAFYDCNSLKFVQLPSNLKTIGNYAFNDCSGLIRVEIPASVTSIGECAFNACASVTEFVVDRANQKYCSDQWGVLYSKDMTNLIVYPANRKWPYYNVPEQTTTISYRAFNSCANLVNLYIPNTVTSLNNDCIVNCPGLTVCAYTDSKAYQYAGEHDLTAWPMDNYTLQGIEIYALPEQLIMDTSSEINLNGLYVTADCGGKTLQLDNYTLTYNPNASGVQTVTVTFGGFTASFEILLYDGSTEYLVDFGKLDLEEGTTGYMAVYDTDGKMLRIDSVATVNGHAMLVVPNAASVGEAKLFILNGSDYAPISAPIDPITSP